MATTLNLEIDQGSTFEHMLTWTSSDSTPIDLTGYTAKMQARAKAGSDTTVFDLSTENGGIALGGTDGTITINISADESTNVSTLKCVYDLELVSPLGVVKRLVQGKIVIDPEVTV